MDCINGLPSLPLLVGFGQWRIPAEVGGRKKNEVRLLVPWLLPGQVSSGGLPYRQHFHEVDHLSLQLQHFCLGLGNQSFPLPPLSASRLVTGSLQW